MKMFDLAKAFANVEDASKISKIVWSHINNPYSGLPDVVTGTSWRPTFTFPENWITTGDYNDGAAWQYAWSSSPATMAIEVLLGIQPSIDNIKIQAIKPSNISTITAINVKVRDALWNISVVGDGNYVNQISIDSVNIDSQTIPSTYYSGSHTVEITLGTSPIEEPIIIAGDYTLTVFITQNNIHVSNANVTIGGDTKQTNLLGYATFTLPYGTYTVTATLGEHTKTVQVLVNQDKTIGINFEAATTMSNPSIVALPLLVFAIATAVILFMRKRK